MLRKCLRPSKLYRSEIVIQKILQVLQNSFVDLCNDELKKGKLYDLLFKFSIADTAADCLLSHKQRGKAMMEDFKTLILI